jgi:hypothetical protein
MRTWAHSTAKTVMLTATFAAAGAGLPSAAFAATGGAGGSGCGNAAAVLGDPAAGCEAVAAVQQATGTGTAGAPHSVPMRRLAAAPPIAGSLLPGLATLPVLSALQGQPAQALSVGGAENSSPAVHVPKVHTKPATVHLPAGTTRNGVTRLGRRGTVAPRSPQAAPRGLAVLGALPAAAGAPDLTDHAAPPAASAITADSTAVRNAMPASTLAADSAPGMGSASFYCLAIGAVMAGAVALKMAGRRIRGRKA